MGRTELGLAARPLEEHHQISRDGQRHVPAEVLFHQSQCEVDAGGHARGGSNRAVTHENWIGFDVHGGEASRQVITERPVRGRAASIKHSRCCK
jgi:hypothetical protein